MKHLSRRALLRGSLAGACVSLALPPLELMFDSTGAYADGAGDEPWFGVFFWANGAPWHAGHGTGQAGHPDLWTPPTTGKDYVPSELLQPLAPHRVSVASGLEPWTEIPSEPFGQDDGHMRGCIVALTGDRPRTEGFDWGTHLCTVIEPTIDQVVATHPDFYSVLPRFRSLHAGASTTLFHQYGHWKSISFNGPDSVNPPIVQPSQLFDLLFDRGSSGDAEPRSRALDAVLEDAQQLRRRLGTRDRERLDAHLEHIFELQRRLAIVDGGECIRPDRPADDGDLIEITSVMAELFALAISCGQTRVVTFRFTSPGSPHFFTNLGVFDGMHKTAHDGLWESIRTLTLYQMQAFAAFLDEFAAIELPNDQTLLDRGCVFGVSEYGEGWGHSVREVPIVLAGSACGGLERGVHTREPGGNISKAHLTVLRSLGLPYTGFGFHGGETSDPVAGMLG